MKYCRDCGEAFNKSWDLLEGGDSTQHDQECAVNALLQVWLSGQNKGGAVCSCQRGDKSDKRKREETVARPEKRRTTPAPSELSSGVEVCNGMSSDDEGLPPELLPRVRPDHMLMPEPYRIPRHRSHPIPRPIVRVISQGEGTSRKSTSEQRRELRREKGQQERWRPTGWPGKRRTKC